MRPFRDHDEIEYKRLVDWQRQMKTKGANKEKPERPEVSFWFPPADLTNPAFIQNAMALEKQGGRTMYLDLPEVEMADRMCGGHRQVSQTIRNIYDRHRAGALRATAEGVTGNPILRVNITFSSTPDAARSFYKKDLTNGFFGRIPFSYKARGERKGRIPRQGCYDENLLARLDEYLVRLDNCKGRFVVKPLNKIADQLAEEMASLADLADDDMLFELSHRSIFSAWKKGATLWILNNQTWSRSIGEFVVWFNYTAEPTLLCNFDASRYERFFERPWLSDEARRFLFDERRIDPRVVRWCRLTSWRDKQGIPWLQTPYYDREGKLIGIQNRNLSSLTPSPSPKGDGSLPLHGEVGGSPPRFRFPQGSQCSLYGLPVLNLLKAGDELYITEGCSDCWAMLSAGHKAIAIPSATLLTKKDVEQLSIINSQLSITYHMYPDRDEPGERLFLQLKERLPNLVHHQLPPGYKDFGDYYKLHWKTTQRG